MITTTSTLNPILSGIANQFMRDPSGFVARKLAPPFPAALQAASYYVFTPESMANVPLLKPRAPGSGYPRVMRQLSNDNYFCQNFGLESPVPDEERKKYAAFFDVDVAAVRLCTDTLTINHEQRVHDAATDPTKVTAAVVQVPWNDGASNPKTDVDATKTFIRQNSGMMPNIMVISEPVFFQLQQHPRLLDLFKYTSPGLLNEDKLANYFGLPTGGLQVARSVVATNIEGQQFNPADIWGTDVVLAHAESGPDLTLPNFMRTFYWTAFSSEITPATGGTGYPTAAGGGGPELVSVADYRDETKKSDIHRTEHYVTEKIVGAKAAFCLQQVLR